MAQVVLPAPHLRGIRGAVLERGKPCHRRDDDRCAGAGLIVASRAIRFECDDQPSLPALFPSQLTGDTTCQALKRWSLCLGSDAFLC